ncbi:MAG TPA: hypothetical protein VG389_14610 [Myxococcota bacterium]|jgi:DNA-directed RNA polymerase subunit RPC12/RpoP|nr:hypothetical protein [Myxococcota bacterium]
METGDELRCSRCGSRELALRGAGYRCWRCGARVERPDPLPSPAPPRPVAPPPADTTASASAQTTAAPGDPPRARAEPEPAAAPGGLPEPPFGPFASPAAVPIDVPEEERFVVPLSVPRDDGERIAREAIRGGFFRPADIDGAVLAPLALVWAPYWRIDAGVEGFHVGLTHVGGGGPRGRGSMVLPTGGFRHRDEVLLVPARRFLAFDTARELVIRVEEMVARAQHPIAEGEVVEPDVTRLQAEEEAKRRLRQRVQPSSALYARYEAQVRSAALVHYPLWLARYRYRGQATSDLAPVECHVAVSGRSGEIVSARHPSAWRAAFGKVKRFFGATDAAE